MITITQQRVNCIGCNACVEVADYRWRISRKDGKCTLVGGKDKRGFFTVAVPDFEYEDALKAAQHCPVNIIKVTKN